MKSGWVLLGVMLVASVTGGWLYRDQVMASWTQLVAMAQGKPAQPAAPAQPDVVYSWVDDQGVTHYGQKAAGDDAERIVLDGSRITPMGEVPAGPALPAVREATEGATREGAASLHAPRDELKAGAERMQQAKAAAQADL